MGTSRDPGEPSPYHHGDLRVALVEEALGMMREGGPAALSLREVTRRAGVTPAAAYRHFRNREALVAAAAREIQQRMTALMRAAMRAPDGSGGSDGTLGTVGPVGTVGPEGAAGSAEVTGAGEPAAGSPAEAALRRLRGVGLGYIGFARREPGWFGAVFFGSPSEQPPTGSVGGHEAAAPFTELVAALDACVAAGVIAPERRPGAEFVCWSAVHGCAELMIHGPLRGAPGEMLDDLSVRVVEDVIAGVR